VLDPHGIRPDPCSYMHVVAEQCSAILCASVTIVHPWLWARQQKDLASLLALCPSANEVGNNQASAKNTMAQSRDLQALVFAQMEAETRYTREIRRRRSYENTTPRIFRLCALAGLVI